MPPKGFKTLSLTINEESYKKFVEYCKQNRRSPASVLRDFVVNVNGKPTLIDIYERMSDISVAMEKSLRSISER